MLEYISSIFFYGIPITYDMSDDKLRSQFSRYIRKYARRVQYSVYEINNSERIIANVLAEIEGKFEPKFWPTDSIMLIPISGPNEEKIVRYGYLKNEELDYLFID